MLAIELPTGFYIRMVTDDDHAFCLKLYSESREELNQFGLEADTLGPLLQMQYRIQQQGIKIHYPNAEHWILSTSQEAIGRVIVHVNIDHLRVIDIAISRCMRKRGYASTLIQSLQHFAGQQNLSLKLAVSKTNANANTLYRRLGFTLVSEDQLYSQLQWHK